MELTKKEYMVAEHLTRGKSEKEIAVEMFVSPKTFNNHTYNIRKQWNARCAVDIARKFILQLEGKYKNFTHTDVRDSLITLGLISIL